MAEALQVIII